MVRALLLLCIGGCFTKPGFSDVDADAPQASWLMDAPFRKPITLTKITPGSLTDHTVSIALTADPDLAAHARADGLDLVFTAGDGTTVLAHELVDYASGTVDAWVRIPELVAGNNELFVYYGRDPDVPSSSAAWSESYAGVWHLGSNGPYAEDSTLRTRLEARDLSPGPGTGIVGGAREFDASSMGNEGMCGMPPAIGMDSFSYAVWVRPEPYADFDTPLARGGNLASSAGYTFELGNGEWAASIADGTSLVTYGFAAGPPAMWSYLVAVIERPSNVARVYLNGSEVSSTTPAAFGTFGSVDGVVPLCIGSSPQPRADFYYHFDGMIDEPRIYGTAITADAIATEYANIASRATFQRVGAEQVRD